MLLVRTRVGPSPIHGLGLFADQAIPAGTEIWRFAPGLDVDVAPGVVERLPDHVRAFFARYGYVDRRLARYVLCFDDARFMNHSDRPNVAVDADGRHVRALVAIEPGDELTIDYLAQPVPERYLRSTEVRRLRTTVGDTGTRGRTSR